MLRDAEKRNIKAGDTVMVFNQYGRMLRKVQPLQSIMPGVVAIPHGPHSVLDETDPNNIIDRGGSEQILYGVHNSNYYQHFNSYNSIICEIEKYNGETLVEDYERGPFLAKGIDD